MKSHMFAARAVPGNLIPEGVILASDREWVVGQFSQRILSPKAFITHDDVTEEAPFDSLNIPPGYRAVSIRVDARSGVEGFAKPNSRVDVLWIFTHGDGTKRVATIVPFAKVLSVDGITRSKSGKVISGGEQTTATLLVAHRDAKMIELARSTGQLTLSLVGNQEPLRYTGEPDLVTMRDLLRKVDAYEEPEQVLHEGEFWTFDPATQKPTRYTLARDRWTRTAEEGIEPETASEPEKRRARMVSEPNWYSTQSMLPGAPASN